MEAMIILILISLTVAIGFLIAFLRSAGSGQFEDMISPAVRMLGDDTPQPPAQTETNHQ